MIRRIDFGTVLQQVKSLDDRISQALDPVGPILDTFEKLAAGEGATATWLPSVSKVMA